MAVAHSICAFAISAFEAAAEVPGGEMGGRTAAGAVRWLSHQIKEPRRLETALSRSRDQVWTAVELGLTGYTGQSVWKRVQDKVFQDAAHRNVGEELRQFFLSALAPVVRTNPDFPRACLDELKQARQRGVLTDEPESAIVARMKPQQALIGRQEQALNELSAALRPSYPHLGQLTDVKLPPQNHYMLVSLARYFFQQEVAQDPELHNSLVSENLDRVLKANAAHAKRLEALHVTVSKHQQWLAETLDVIQDAIRELGDDVRAGFNQSHRNDAEIQKKLDELGRMVEVLASSGQTSAKAEPSPKTSPKPAKRAPAAKHLDGGGASADKKSLVKRPQPQQEPRKYTVPDPNPAPSIKIKWKTDSENNPTVQSSPDPYLKKEDAGLEGVWSAEGKSETKAPDRPAQNDNLAAFDENAGSTFPAQEEKSKANLDGGLFGAATGADESKQATSGDDVRPVKNSPPPSAKKNFPTKTNLPDKPAGDPSEKQDLADVWDSDGEADDKKAAFTKTERKFSPPPNPPDDGLWT